MGSEMCIRDRFNIFPSRPILSTPAAEHIAAPNPIKAIGVALRIKLLKREISKISSHSIYLIFLVNIASSFLTNLNLSSEDTSFCALTKKIKTDINTIIISLATSVL